MQTRRILSLILAAACMLTLGGCQSADESPEGDAPTETGVAVQVTQVTLDTVSTENRVSGKIVADSETSIMVASTAKCTEVYVQAGDEVEAGDKICRLDLESTLSSYSAASISYQSAASSYQDQKAIFDKQVALYEKNLKDTRALLEIGAASQAEVDAAELNLMTAKAQRDSTLAQLEAGMQSYKSNMEQLKLVIENVDADGNVIAPVSGTLVSLSAVENGFVSASMPVAVINGVEQMKVSVSVSEALVPKLGIGDEVDVSVSAVDANFTGTVRSVEKTANLQTKLYAVTVSVPADVPGLLSGMSADVTFHTDVSAGAVVVPSEAVLTSGQTQYVYVVEEGLAKYVEVTTGLIGNGVTEITSGLEAGAELVTTGQTYLSDGEPVRIVTVEG
ncbi:efflux RND transporter periplasmic adaptor subunit [Feifania hominis]|uniref:Efflux RND transporter periplasmic adaptor subunit n=1 Tax=Feifania hominis TaxID=2763660 RepID=A0A926HU12_9FIRM|nr:efflux RND transporter periplasmic adaptor subunit [Feifania hominis]MBC8535833.1 efflux RND transporter periplasmic adaptor subunit [Feifania hominis]